MTSTNQSSPAIWLHERPGPGPEVILLHGIPGSSSAWDAVISQFPDDWRIFAPDLAGFGESERVNDIALLHASGQAAALERALSGVISGTPLLVGHDFGGPVAIELLRRMPGRFSAVVLAATNIRSDTPIPFPLSLVNAPLVGSFAARLLFSRPSLRMMYRRGAHRRHVEPGPGLGDAAQSRAIGRIFAHSLRHLAELYAPIEAFASGLDLPVGVVWGDRDPFFGPEHAEATAKLIPGATLRLLPGCGHFVPEEAPAELAELIVSLAAHATTLPAGHSRS